MSSTPETANVLSFHEVASVPVALRNVSVTVQESATKSTWTSKFGTKSAPRDLENSAQHTVLLDNVSGKIPERQLTAIMGASGSGKTTLCVLFCTPTTPSSCFLGSMSSPIDSKVAASKCLDNHCSLAPPI